MKKIHHPSQLQTMIADYQLEQIFPKDCLSQLEPVSTRQGITSAVKELSKGSFLIFSKDD